MTTNNTPPIPTYSQPIVDAKGNTTRPWYFYFQYLANKIAAITGLTPSGVTAGSYTNANVTVNSNGIITSASSGAASGLTLTDGTHTVTGVTQITASGATVGGASPNATLTIAASGGGNVTADTHPSSPNAANDEFEYGTSIDLTGARFSGATAWTWVNQLTCTTSVFQGALVITNPSPVSGINHSYIKQPTSGSTWAYTCKMSTSGGGNNEAGMIIGISSGAFITWNLQNGSLLSQDFNGPASYAGTLNYNASAPGGYASYLQPFVYLQVSFDGTNINLSASTSGIPGSFYTFFSNSAASSFLGTAPTFVGLGVDIVAGPQYAAVFDWFRKTA